MLFDEAKELIYRPKYIGFRVTFEKRNKGILHGDFFPDESERPFETEREAWDWAERFSKVANMVNIYVTYTDHTPVNGYRKKMFNRHALG